MFASTGKALILFAYSFAVGMILGCFYDLIMILVNGIAPIRLNENKTKVKLGENAQLAEKSMFSFDRRICKRDVLLFFCDILFCVVSAFTVIILLYHLNYGEIRVLSLVLALAGFFVYRKTLGIPIKLLQEKLLLLVFGFLRKTVKVLLFPIFIFAVKVITPPIKKITLKIIRKKAKRYLLSMKAIEVKRRKIKK